MRQMAWNSNDDDLKVDSDFRSLISFFNAELFNLNQKKLDMQSTSKMTEYSRLNSIIFFRITQYLKVSWY